MPRIARGRCAKRAKPSRRVCEACLETRETSRGTSANPRPILAALRPRRGLGPMRGSMGPGLRL
eukprot:3479472-Prymnesium_polylepis.1